MTRGGRSPVSPNGAAAVADPTTLRTTTTSTRVHPGFNLSEGDKSRGHGDPSPSTDEASASRSGYLDEAVEKKFDSQVESGFNSNGSTRSKTGDANTSQRGLDLSLSGGNKLNSSGVASSNSVERGSDDSPEEPAFLEGYGEASLSATARSNDISPPVGLTNSGHGQEDVRPVDVPIITRQSSSFDDTLGPWKEEKTESTNPFANESENLRDEHTGMPVLQEEQTSGAGTQKNERREPLNPFECDDGNGSHEVYRTDEHKEEVLGRPGVGLCLSEDESGGFGGRGRREGGESEEGKEWLHQAGTHQGLVGDDDVDSAAARNTQEYGYGYAEPGT